MQRLIAATAAADERLTTGERRQPEQPLPRHTTTRGQLHPLLATRRQQQPHLASVGPSKMAAIAAAVIERQ